MIPNPLDETDNTTPPPAEVARMAQKPATELDLFLRCRTCPTTRSLRRWAMLACVVLGAGLAFQIVGWTVIEAKIDRSVGAAIKEAFHRHDFPPPVPPSFARE